MDSDQLDGITSIRTYVDRLVTGDGRCNGMKVLLLDGATTQILSCVSTQSEILTHEVYLVSRLDDPRCNPNLKGLALSSNIATDENGGDSNNNGGGGIHSLALQEEAHVGHMKAVCFLRPTDNNIGLLVRELSRPRFSEYHIYFSGILPPTLFELLSENDPHERVRQVQEFYADFLPINPDLFSLNCRNTLKMTTALYQRNLAGLQSMLLASKRQPGTIRYQKSSRVARQLAQDVSDSIISDDIFHFRRGTGSGVNNNLLLLIVDRMDDPVTPLLSQWTYQAMVHELLGLNNNRVILRGVPNVSKDLEEVVLSSAPGHDSFFRTHRNSNFGELGEAIQKLLQDYQARSKEHQVSNLKTVEDMQHFMEKYPELRSESHTVSKHVAIMGELARLVEVCSLMDVSAFEQDFACADDQGGHLKELMVKLNSSSIKIPDKLRLGMLYALRYENAMQNAIPAVKEAMRRGGVPPNNIALVDAVLKYAGSKVRGPGLYGTNQSSLSKMTKSFMTSVQGVSNVYSQHSPLLMDTIESAVKGKLRGEDYPMVTKIGSRVGVDNLPLPQEVLIFMVGGMTYEEATKVSEFNEANAGRVRVVLGGSTVHNSTSFLEELKLI
jgi:vacuolar protein sorting-associated protein 45